MKNIIATTILSAFTMLIVNICPASDHLDAPLVFADGRLDINDSYIFRATDNPENTVMIMTVNPAAGVMSPTTFAANAIYELNIDNTGDAIPDITFSLRFNERLKNGQQRFVLRRNGALVARGLTGSESVSIRSVGGLRIRCDLFEDPFFFDLNGFNDGFNFTGNDFFAGLNTSAIILEVPSASLLGTNGSNISLACRTATSAGQFDRFGRPAINTALIPSGMKDAFNAGLPVNDPANFGDTVRASIESLNGGDAETAAALTAVLLPDVLTIDLAAPSGFLNGRLVADDVIDAELELLTNGGLTTDMVDANDVPFPDGFPYLGNPHN